MKTVFFTILSATLILCYSCQKEDIGPKLKREAAEKVYGSWLLERQVDEVYSPIETLTSSVEITGTKSDLYIFRRDEFAEIHSAEAESVILPFEVVNPNQMILGENVWRIERLTTKEMTLVLDKNDVVQYKRYVTRLYLKK